VRAQQATLAVVLLVSVRPRLEPLMVPWRSLAQQTMLLVPIQRSAWLLVSVRPRLEPLVLHWRSLTHEMVLWTPFAVMASVWTHLRRWFLFGFAFEVMLLAARLKAPSREVLKQLSE
jgi:hypothetical protein